MSDQAEFVSINDDEESERTYKQHRVKLKPQKAVFWSVTLQRLHEPGFFIAEIENDEQPAGAGPT